MPHRVSQALWATIATSILVLAGRGLLVAQSPPLAAAAVTGTVTGACHVRPIVSDLDRAAHFYHDILGLDLVPSPPPGALPWVTMPGFALLLEFLELKGFDRTLTASQVQDPGSSSRRVVPPVSMTFKSRPWRPAIAPDPEQSLPGRATTAAHATAGTIASRKSTHASPQRS